MVTLNQVDSKLLYLIVCYFCTQDEILKQELNQRDGKISDLSEKYAKEHKVRSKTEAERNSLNQKLVSCLVHACVKADKSTTHTLITYFQRLFIASNRTNTK